jgi:hypothetical protein
VNILYVVADNRENEWNSSEWRCAIPMRCIAALKGHGAAMITIPQFEKSLEVGTSEMATVSMCDLIYFQRNMSRPESFRAAKYWQGTGRPVIVDIDDDYLGLPAANPAYLYWYGNNGANIKALMQYVPQMDLLTSPNKLILEKWRKVGVQNTLWLPNYAQGTWFENAQKQPHEGFWVGWGGSASHYDTWFRSGCAEGVKLALAKLPDARFVMMGTDKRVLDMIDVPAEQKVYAGCIMPKEIFKWPQALAQFDLNLCPLGGTYDQHRSWIHALESMLAHVPFVCSRGVPYAELGKFGKVVDDSPQEWCNAIVEAHDHYERWTELAHEAYKQGIQYTMEARATEYVIIMNKLAEERRVRVGARMPGIMVVT